MDINDVDFEPGFDNEEGFQQLDSLINEEPTGVTTTVETPEYTGGENVTPGGNNGGAEKTSEDVMHDFLKFNGIADPEKIKFEDEDGIVKERAWKDLSYEEQMNILTTSAQQPERDLDDNEIALLNEIRSRNLTPSQYIDTIRQQAAQDYADNLHANPQYKVSDLSDDEIFILDLQDKLGDEEIPDEQILAALEKAKEDPLFEKRVAGMRKTLEAQEAQYLEQQRVEQEALEEEQLNQFRGAVVQNIQALNKIGDLDINLDREDQEDIAAFILDRDETGMSYMGKALNDPQTLVELAFFALKGRETLSNISDYFAQQIKEVRLTSYQKGLEDGKKGASRVVYKPQVQGAPSTIQGRETTIDDIWG